MSVRNIVLIVVAVVLLAGVGATVGIGLFQNSPGVPESFEIDFRGFGYVEKIAEQRDGCRVQLAIYEWINLSPGFEIHEIPRQNDRFTLTGNVDSCQALTVAMAATGQHISFSAGRSGARWFFTGRPEAAYGCGGLGVEWVPEPQS